MGKTGLRKLLLWVVLNDHADSKDYDDDHAAVPTPSTPTPSPTPTLLLISPKPYSHSHSHATPPVCMYVGMLQYSIIYHGVSGGLLVFRVASGLSGRGSWGVVRLGV